MTAFVLDNSVTMRWCFDAGEHERADGFLATLSGSGGNAFVPVIWRYEVSAVLVRAQNSGILAPAKARDFLHLLGDLPITVDDESGGRILSDVHSLAVAYRLTTYDAAYLELALRRRPPLATFDVELVTACRKAGVAVL